MEVEQTMEKISGSSSDLILEGGGINTPNQGSEENGQNDVLGQLNGKFGSREELLDTLRAFFSMQGYAIAIRTSTKGRYVTIGCDRGGSYRNKWHVPIERRQRRTANEFNPSHGVDTTYDGSVRDEAGVEAFDRALLVGW